MLHPKTEESGVAMCQKLVLRLIIDKLSCWLAHSYLSARMIPGEVG